MATSGKYVGSNESRTIDHKLIQKVLENPSGPTLPFKTGDKIRIYTDKNIEGLSKDVRQLDMVVKEIDNESVEGWFEKEDVMVNVKLEGIYRIDVSDTKTYIPPPPGQVVRKTFNLAMVLLVLLLAL